MSPKFSDLHLLAVGNKDVYQLTKDFIWHSGVGDVVVSQDSLTDFDTIPRIPILYSFIKGRARRAYVIHDDIYAKRGITIFTEEVTQVVGVGPTKIKRKLFKPLSRNECDSLLKQASKDEMDSTLFNRVVINTIYIGLALFGWYRWNRAEKRKRELEKCYACE